MEYEFIHDSLTGVASARFSMEHEIMGPWLEVEVGNNIAKITTLLEVMARTKELQQNDHFVNGVEYTLIFSEESVKIVANSQFDDADKADIEENLSTDHDSSAECGIEDFKELIIKWSNFVK